MGNWDDFITKPTEFEALKWHQKQLSEEQNDYLRSLPFSIEFFMSEKLIQCFTLHREVYMKEFNHTLQEKNVLVCSKIVI